MLQSRMITILGILNITPDSYWQPSRVLTPELALERALQMQADGADIIDVGGCSTRPAGVYLGGGTLVSAQEECDRVIPVIRLLRQHLKIPISIDTFQPQVMAAAIDAGATIINDINALQADGALQIAAQAKIPIILMHMQGTPATMQQNPRYHAIVDELMQFFDQRIEACLAAGIARQHLILDPGFGFGKNLQHNLTLLRQLKQFKKFGLPLLAGLSRKTMIGDALGIPVSERLSASISLASFAVIQGCNLIRTHDVAPTVSALRMLEKVLEV